MNSKHLHSLLRQPIARRRLLQLGIPGLSTLLLQSSPLATLMGCNPQSTKLKGKASGLDPNRKFLFVFGAMGGASIHDSFLALRESEVSEPGKLNVFPDRMISSPPGTELRAVDLAMDAIGPLPFEVKAVQSRFLNKYFKDILVTAVDGSTVSHPEGQYRSVTGNGAWNNRTLQEAVAASYGRDLLLANANMSTVGFAEPGKDPSLPAFARPEAIPDPRFFPFALHGYKGIQGAPDGKLIALARRTRDTRLEPESAFMKSYGSHPQVMDWLNIRKKQGSLEALDLINQLNAFEDTTDLPFKNFGLAPNAESEVLRSVFPDLGADPLHTQALLAYLMVTQGLSCTVTFGMGMNLNIHGDVDDPLMTNTPTAFDYSHNAHRATQALLWHRILDTIDRLILLLQATEYTNGKSYWDHSMIYIATEFGRDKTRVDGAKEFTTGHNVNNAVTIISPLVNGNKILGGVDRKNLHIQGYNPDTGAVEPGRVMTEAHVYSGILAALGVDTSGAQLPSVPAMLKKT